MVFRSFLYKENKKLTLFQPISECCYKYLVMGFVNRECLLIEAGYVGSQRLLLLLFNAHQASCGLLVPMSPDEVRNKLSA